MNRSAISPWPGSTRVICSEDAGGGGAVGVDVGVGENGNVGVGEEVGEEVEVEVGVGVGVGVGVEVGSKIIRTVAVGDGIETGVEVMVGEAIGTGVGVSRDGNTLVGDDAGTTGPSRSPASLPQPATTVVTRSSVTSTPTNMPVVDRNLRAGSPDLSALPRPRLPAGCRSGSPLFCSSVTYRSCRAGSGR